MLAFMDAMGGVEELRLIPTWRPHLMTGDRAGTWSLHVTRNWRMTFRVDVAEKQKPELLRVNTAPPSNAVAVGNTCCLPCALSMLM